MKTVEKSRLTKSQKLAIILSSVLLFLVAAIVVLAIIFANRGDQAPVYKLPDVRTDLGESVYAGLPVVYERLTESEIKYMLVSNNKIERNEETGENVKKTYNYALNRYAGNGEFWLSYDLGDGEGVKDLTPYIPPILDAEQGLGMRQSAPIKGTPIRIR